MWLSEEGVPQEEENFEEAIKNVNSALVPTKVRIKITILKSVQSFSPSFLRSKTFLIFLLNIGLAN